MTNQSTRQVCWQDRHRQLALRYCTRIDVSVLPHRSTGEWIGQARTETRTRTRRCEVDLATRSTAIVDGLTSLGNCCFPVIVRVRRREESREQNRVIDLAYLVHTVRIDAVAKVFNLRRLDIRRIESLGCRTRRRIRDIRRCVLHPVTPSDGLTGLSTSAGSIESGHTCRRRQKLLIDSRPRLLPDNLGGLTTRHMGTSVNVLLSSQLLPDKVLATRGHTCIVERVKLPGASANDAGSTRVSTQGRSTPDPLPSPSSQL